LSSVMEYLQGRGVAFTILPSPTSDHPIRTAALHGFPAEDVVSVTLMTGRLGDAMMVIPADRSLDVDLACDALGDPEAGFVSASEHQSRYPGYEPGCVPPLGLFFMVPIYADPQVMRHHWIVFALGRPGLAVRMRTRDLFRDDAVVMAPLTLRSLEPALIRTRRAALEVEPTEDLTIVLDHAD